MNEIPDEIEGDRRKLVLDRCPLLSVFVDPYCKKDKNMWIEMLKKEMISKRDEAVEVVGEERVNKELNGAYREFEECMIFAPRFGKQTKADFLLALILIGYELEDIEEVVIFTGDITDRLDEIKVLNQESVDPYDFIGDALFRGFNIKDEVGEDVNEVWREFIGTLEF